MYLPACLRNGYPCCACCSPGLEALGHRDKQATVICGICWPQRSSGSLPERVLQESQLGRRRSRCIKAACRDQAAPQWIRMSSGYACELLDMLRQMCPLELRLPARGYAQACGLVASDRASQLMWQVSSSAVHTDAIWSAGPSHCFQLRHLGLVRHSGANVVDRYVASTPCNRYQLRKGPREQGQLLLSAQGRLVGKLCHLKQRMLMTVYTCWQLISTAIVILGQHRGKSLLYRSSGFGSAFTLDA